MMNKGVPRLVWRAALCLIGAAVSVSASAAVFVSARDGDTTPVKISIKDDTRIKVQGTKIVDLIGDVYDEEKNPSGALIVDRDDDGEVFVQPRRVGDAEESRTHPVLELPAIKVTLKTTRGKYSLLLQPLDILGDTLIVEPKGAARNAAKGQAAAASQPDFQLATPGATTPPKNSSHYRKLKAMMLAMVENIQPANVEIQQVGEKVSLWKEAEFLLVDKWLADEWVGERYRLKNVSGDRLVMDEKEFFRDGVVGITVRAHDLKANEYTDVFVVRMRNDGE